ncbi:MAG: MFS transporter [Acidobacteriota bacterium]|nr:MFS transporter [Acidobacteriota bacterium]
MNHTKLLIASFLTILVAGLGFAVRGGLLLEWGTAFGFTQTELGQITGGGFVGFGIVILIASLFLDRFGYKPFLILAGVLHVASVVLTVAATFVYNGSVDTNLEAARSGAFFCLFWGIFIFAIANGICEAVVNPLVATLYPKEKTHYLNILHAGWPGGMIIGALLGVVMIGRVRWEIVLALYLVPTLIYLVMMLKEKFPESEAAAAGVSFGEMLKEFAAPVLMLLLVLHVCIGYVELGTDSWIVNIMDTVLGGKGLFILLYTSVLMFVLRFFAGPIVHRISPLGLLFSSAVLAVIGLYALGSFSTAVTVMVAATIYGMGKTFFWPTMLGVVSERFPRGGALTLGAIGGVGMLSAGLLGGPGIGYLQDRYASEKLEETSPALYQEFAAEGSNRFLFFQAVQGLDGSKMGPVMEKAKDFSIMLTPDEQAVRDSSFYGGQMALKVTAIVPAVMALGFLFLIAYFRMTGGYRQVALSSSPDRAPPAP